jgi:ribosome maturation protein SDO1
VVSLDDAVVARLKSHGHTFEMLVDCEKAMKLRAGESIALEDVLASDKVFTQQSKGIIADRSTLEKVFKTTDSAQIAKEIISKGEIQLTAKFRAKERERKLHALIQAIHKNGVDPRTNLPHPVKRIELAFEQAKIHVDDAKRVEAQMEDVVQKLQPILPIRFDTRTIEVRLPPKEAQKAQKALLGFGKKVREEWKEDGSYVLVMQIPAGLQAEFSDYLNTMTHGNNETRVQ